MILACRSSQQAIEDGTFVATPVSEKLTQKPLELLPTPTPPPTSPTTPPGPRSSVITSNDFSLEQVNSIDTVMVLVNFSDQQDQVCDFQLYWDRVFGMDDGPHPDNFPIDPNNVFGDKILDPVNNPTDPAGSNYVNPPTTFVSKEGFLVYRLYAWSDGLRQRPEPFPPIPYQICGKRGYVERLCPNLPSY